MNRNAIAKAKALLATATADEARQLEAYIAMLQGGSFLLARGGERTGESVVTR